MASTVERKANGEVIYGPDKVVDVPDVDLMTLLFGKYGNLGDSGAIPTDCDARVRTMPCAGGYHNPVCIQLLCASHSTSYENNWFKILPTSC